MKSRRQDRCRRLCAAPGAKRNLEPPPLGDGQEKDGGAIPNYYLLYFVEMDLGEGCLPCFFFSSSPPPPPSYSFFFSIIALFCLYSGCACFRRFSLLLLVTLDASAGSFFYESVLNGTNELAANYLSFPSLSNS